MTQLINEPASSNTAAKKLRGSVIVEAKDSIKEAYGTAIYDAALAALDSEQREIVQDATLTVGFYPIAPWDQFLQNVVEEVRKQRGESAEQFFSRLVRFRGGRMARLFYKGFLRVMQPQRVVKQLPTFWMRLYTSGDLEVKENTDGRCVLTFTDDSPAYRHNLVHFLPPSLKLLLGMAGASNVTPQVTRDEYSDTHLFLEFVTTYDL